MSLVIWLLFILSPLFHFALILSVTHFCSLQTLTAPFPCTFLVFCSVPPIFAYITFEFFPFLSPTPHTLNFLSDTNRTTTWASFLLLYITHIQFIPQLHTVCLQSIISPENRLSPVPQQGKKYQDSLPLRTNSGLLEKTTRKR